MCMERVQDIHMPKTVIHWMLSIFPFQPTIKTNESERYIIPRKTYMRRSRHVQTRGDSIKDTLQRSNYFGYSASTMHQSRERSREYFFVTTLMCDTTSTKYKSDPTQCRYLIKIKLLKK